MDKVLGVVNLMNEPQFLKDLTNQRCLASTPFGGRYRLIDFTLSNLIHADITKVAVFVKEKYRSLMDHLGSGKEWDLDHHSGGLYILPPIHPGDEMKGDLQQFSDHLEFFERSSAKTVIISPGNQVCKMDFNEIVTEHRRKKADITVVYKDYDGDPVRKPIYHKCYVDAAGDISDIELYTSPRPGDHVSLETYVIDKQLLIDLIKKSIENDEYDFLKDALKANLNNIYVTGYEFKGLMPFVHSLDTFHSANMAFLKPEVLQSFFYETWDIYTKVKHEAPAKYTASSRVTGSLIANGCEIEGIVENSIIFRGVKVKEGAVVKNSIIMQKGEIEAGAHLENVIADKQVRITENQVVVGGMQPKVLKKSEVI